MSFVGLDPDRAGVLAAHLDEAAADLEAHAQTIERLLAQAGIVSSQAPAQIRDVANWAAYRSRDLRRRIDQIVAADHIGAGPRVPGFRFATKKGAVEAADDTADKLRELLGKGSKKALGGELRAMAPYLADQRYAAELFKRLGPKGTFDVLSATQASPAVLVLGRALAVLHASGAISDAFLKGILEAARKRAASLDSYMHPWGAASERDRAKVALNEYVHGADSPPGSYKFLEAIAPLLPYLEAGTKVAIIGGAVVIVTAVGACAALSAGSCLGPASAFAEEGAVIFASEAPSVATDLFETLPLSMQEETEFGRFIDQIHARLPQMLVGGIRGSSATGVSWETGEPFNEASDIDLAIVDTGLWEKAQELGYKVIGGGTRTWPLKEYQLDGLGLRELQAELTEIAGHDVSIMLYRTMDDVFARGPFIVIPPP
jgi:hypothetical protein